METQPIVFVGVDWASTEHQVCAPTPHAAKRLKEKKIARILQARRIRRLTATEILEILKRPALLVGPGTEPAAVAHISGIAERDDDASCCRPGL